MVWKASSSAWCMVEVGRDASDPSPSQEGGASWAAPCRALLQEVTAAHSQRCLLFFDSGAGWVWVRGEGKDLVEGVRTPASGCPMADCFVLWGKPLYPSGSQCFLSISQNRKNGFHIPPPMWG